MSTNFRLKFIEPSVREVFILWTLVKRKDREEGQLKRGEENMAHIQRDSKQRQSTKKLLTFNVSSRQLYKLHAKIIGHVVDFEVGCRDASKTYRAAIKKLVLSSRASF